MFPDLSSLCNQARRTQDSRSAKRWVGAVRLAPFHDYFRERVWISCDPDERTIPALAQRFGADRFMWASDFPHADHTPEYIGDLEELAAAFDEKDRRQFLGDNARALYGIDV